jgi:hypothetical protein
MTQLRLVPHSVLSGEHVIEIWADDDFVGQVVALDDAIGVRVLSKHRLGVEADVGAHRDSARTPNVVTVEIKR